MERPREIFYGWFIVAASFAILFAIHGAIINTFGVFVKPVSESMGWGRATFSVALGIGALAMAFGAPFVGRMIDTLGAKKTMLAGCALCGAGTALLGGARELWHFYVLFTVVGLGLSAATMVPVSVVVANWFDQKRGLAMGIAFTGTSLGGMFMNPVNTKLVETFGWRKSYVLLAIAITAVAVPLVLLIIRTRPSEMGLQPDGGIPAEKEAKPISGHTLKQALRTSAFWFIAANMLLTNFMANAIGVHCIPYLTDIGHSAMTAATTFGLSMGFMTLGKIGLGFWADRWGARRTFVLSAVMTAAGIGTLMLATPWWMLAIFVFMYGFPQGGPLTLTPLVTADCHGLSNFGSIFGLLTLFSILGAAFGPVVVGLMYDTTHSYQGAFALLIVLTLLSGYCIHMARSPEELEPAPQWVQDIDKAANR